MAEGVTIDIEGKDNATREIQSVERSLKGLEKEVDDVEDQFEEADRQAEKFRSSVSGLGSVVSSAAAPIAKIGAAAAATGAVVAGASVAAFASFEKAIVSAGTKVQATEAQLKKMEQAAIFAGQKSAFSAKEAADAMGFLAQAGFDVKQQMEALPEILDFASAGEIKVAKAADIAARAIKSFGLEIDQTTRVTDTLVRVSNAVNTNVTQLSQAFNLVAPNAAAMGVSIEEASAAIGILSNVGIRASRAGTGLRGVLAKIPKVAKKLGVTVRDSQGRIKSLASALKTLQAAGLDSKNAVDLFGRRAGTAIQAILNKGVPAITKLKNGFAEMSGASEIAKKKLNTVHGSLKVLSGSVQTLGIKMGDRMAPAIKDIADELTEMTNNLAKSDTFLDQVETGFENVTIAATEFLDRQTDLIVKAAVLTDTIRNLTKDIESFGTTVREFVPLYIQVITRGVSLGVKKLRKLNGESDAFTSTAEKMNSAVDRISKRMKQLAKNSDLATDNISSWTEAVKVAQKVKSGFMTSIQDDLNFLLPGQKKGSGGDGGGGDGGGGDGGGPSSEMRVARMRLRASRMQAGFAKDRLKMLADIAEIRNREIVQAKKQRLIEKRRAEFAKQRAKAAKKQAENQPTTMGGEAAVQQNKIAVRTTMRSGIGRVPTKDQRTPREKRADRAFDKQMDRKIKEAAQKAKKMRQRRAFNQKDLSQIASRQRKIASNFELIGAKADSEMAKAADSMQQLTSSLGQATALTKEWANVTEFGSKKAASALGNSGKAVAGFAKALGASAKQQASILGAFEAAAAAAATAAGIAGNPQMFAAAAQHGIAAGMYFALAGKSNKKTSKSTGAGATPGAAGMGGGTMSPSGGSGRTGQMKKQAELFAQELSEQQKNRPVVMNIDFGSSTRLESAADMRRELVNNLRPELERVLRGGG